MSSSWHKPTLICVGAAVAVAAAIKVWKQRRALEAEPTPLELMALRNSLMHSEASMKAGREFKPRPSDIFIVTYPKCGTTWVTQICHSLRTRGDMSFEEITEVVPWDICALDCDQHLSDEQVANPRLYKSHERYESVPKGAKYIYVARHPLDAFVSFYHFLPAYMGLLPGALSMIEFANAIFAGVSVSGGIWGHYASWWTHRNDPNVLWIFFEDLKKNLPHVVAQIAAFMDVDTNDKELLAIATEKSSFRFMSEHSAQFDDHFLRNKVKGRMGLDKIVGKDTNVGKVRKGGGKVGSRSTIPQYVLDLLETRWAESLAKDFNLKDYGAMRAAHSASK